jgi:hypothetical protein
MSKYIVVYKTLDIRSIHNNQSEIVDAKSVMEVRNKFRNVDIVSVRKINEPKLKQVGYDRIKK